MGNLFDCLAWRGDLTFDRSPFGPVDGLILSALSYVHFDALVSESLQEAPVRLGKRRRATSPFPQPGGAAAGAKMT